MTDINYTHITLVVDRSGSMQTIKSDAQGGIDAFLTQQATLGVDDPKIRCTLSLVEFDDEYKVVYDFVNIKGQPRRYTLIPRGSTALLDAIGKAATTTGQRLAALPEAERPGQVYLVVMTDGQENASREWTKQQVTDLLKQQQEQYGWQVTFLSSDLNAVADAQQWGVVAGSTLATAAANYGQAVFTNSTAILRSRTATYAGGQSVAMEYTDEERESVS